MRNFVPCLRSGLLARVAVAALLCSGVAACSSDTTRFGEDPFSNPFSSASNEPAQPDRGYTGSVQAAPTEHVQRSPLGAPSAAQARPMRGFDGNGGGYRSSSLEPRSTGSISAIHSNTTMAPQDSPNWSADGGTVITLGQGDTIRSVSQRYGVPAGAIMQANNLQNANGVGPGTRLIIPVYSVGSRAAAPAPYRAAAAAPAPYRAPAAAPAPYRAAEVRPAPMAAPRQAPAPIRTASNVHVGPQQAPAAPAASKSRMEFVQGPQGKGALPAPAAAKPAAPVKTAALAPAPKPLAPQPAAPVAKPAPQPIAQAKPAPQQIAQAKPASSADDNVKTASLQAEPEGPSFRWPVRGRVISAYGSKTSGSSNDGINVAVPEGTDVKASDDGVVAYAGSELKGFGNLVLIRHANGWVTAYAHNSELDVKKGQTVRRGQVIAKSGATGNVSSPQLHFEVRKGASAVDPLQHLPNV